MPFNMRQDSVMRCSKDLPMVSVAAVPLKIGRDPRLLNYSDDEFTQALYHRRTVLEYLNSLDNQVEKYVLWPLPDRHSACMMNRPLLKAAMTILHGVTNEAAAGPAVRGEVATELLEARLSA
jgi:hypothetical protein